jgi:signal transduction histidine kinase
VIHLVAGAVTGILILAAGLPIAGMLVLLLDGRPIELPGWSVQVPTTVGGWALALLIATVIVVVSTAIIAGLGIAAAASAPSLLGPVGEDRLRLAERRLEHEQASLRLSRDLHDGVGHSLSAISLQAGAGRRAVACGGDPDALIQTLHTIEELSGRAVQELDHALSVLRGETSTEPASTAGGDADADKHPDPVAARKPVAKTAAVGRVGRMDLGRLENLVSEHRALGMELEVQLPTSEQISDLPPVLSRAAYRVTAEALANASKHGVAGARVVLNLRRLSHELALDVHNQIADRDPDGSPAAGPSDSNGRGLDALREQLAILGGTISAGPDPVPGEDGPGTGPWHLRVNLPTGGGPRG